MRLLTNRCPTCDGRIKLDDDLGPTCIMCGRSRRLRVEPPKEREREGRVRRVL